MVQNASATMPHAISLDNASNEYVKDIDPPTSSKQGATKQGATKELWRGLIFASLSALMFSICSCSVKRLKYMHVTQLAAVRFIGIFALSLPIVACRSSPVFGSPDARWMLLVRAVAGAVSLMLRFYAFQNVSLGEASTIIFSSPLFVAILARIFLKEACSLSQIIMCFLTLVGIALISKLPMLFGGEDVEASLIVGEHNERLYGLVAALSSCVFAATVIVLLRKLKETDPYVIMFNFGWIAFVISIGGICLLPRQIVLPQNYLDVGLLVTLAVLSFLGQLLLTLSLRSEQAGPVSVMRATVDIVAVFVWQLIFFNDIPDSYTLAGVLIVMSCVIFTGFRKWALSLAEDHFVRKTLGWLF